MSHNVTTTTTNASAILSTPYGDFGLEATTAVSLRKGSPSPADVGATLRQACRLALKLAADPGEEWLVVVDLLCRVREALGKRDAAQLADVARPLARLTLRTRQRFATDTRAAHRLWRWAMVMRADKQVGPLILVSAICEAEEAADGLLGPILSRCP